MDNPATPVTRSDRGVAKSSYIIGPTLKPCLRGPVDRPDSLFVLEPDTPIY